MRTFRSRPLPFLVSAIALLAWLVVYPLTSRAARQLSAFSGDRPLPDAVLTDTEAFLPLNAEMIVGAKVTDVMPSPDGAYLLAERVQVDFKGIPDAARPLEGECSLVLWNRRTRRTSVVWKSPLNEQTFAKVDRLAWLNGTDVALAEITIRRIINGQPQEQRQLLRINAARAAAAPVAMSLASADDILVSPALPLALVSGIVPAGESGSARRRVVWIITANGSVSAPIALPPRSVLTGRWFGDGAKALVVVQSPGAPGESREIRQQRQTWYAIDLRSATVTALSAAPSADQDAPAPVKVGFTRLPIQVRSSTAIVKEGETARKLRPLWLESEDGSSGAPVAARSTQPTKKDDRQTRTLIAADAESGFLMPDGKTCIYQAQGALYAVPILRVNKAAYLDAHRKAMRQAAMSNAKQVGIAMMMYAQDYDEMFPPPDIDVREAIYPYVKNDSVFNDPSTGAAGIHFQYTVTGLADIQKPAETILGYITGPGGRAVIYADGHVKWEDD